MSDINDRGYAHPPADTKGDEGGAFSGPFQLVQGGIEQDGAGCPEREGERSFFTTLRTLL